MSTELYELLSEPVKRAARSASYTWHGLLEEDDIEQMLWVEILESPATASKLRESDADLTTDLLTRMAERICIAERDDYEHFTGNYRYSVSEVKELAEIVFVRTGEELAVDIVDFEVSFDELTKTHDDYAESIFRRYALGEIADGGAAKMRLSRGLTELTNKMNRNFKKREREFWDGPEVREPTGIRYGG